jgi:hypothetical protein
MWSDRYNYYNIQSDAQFSQKLDAAKVTDILLKTQYLKQKDHQTFTNMDDFPWL